MNPAEIKTLIEELKVKQQSYLDAQAAGEARVGELEKRVEELKVLSAQLQKALNGSQVSLPGLETEAHKFRFLNVLRGLVTGRQEGFEWEVLRQAQKTAVDTGTSGAGGGYLIPTELMPEIIPALVANQVLTRLGVTRLTPTANTGTFAIPTQSSTATAYWGAENAVLTESNAVFSQFTMVPHRVGTFTKISKRLLMDAVPGVEQMIRNDLFGAVGRTIDYAALMGNAIAAGPTDSYQPDGIYNLISSRGVSLVELGPDADTGKLMTLGEVGKFEGPLEDNNVETAVGCAFVAHPKVFRKMRKERIPQFADDTKGAYVLMPMNDAQLRAALDYDFQKTTALPTNVQKGAGGSVNTPVFFGKWVDFLYMLWQSITIGASDVAAYSTSSAFLQNQLWVKIEAECDVNVRYGKSFAVCKDVITPTDV